MDYARYLTKMTDAPLILWFRKDLRLDDNPMLAAAVRSGRPLVPVFILDPETEALGAAPKWRLGLGAGAFARTLAEKGLRLIFRRGKALEVLQSLIAETGATSVWWARTYDPPAVARDTAIKAALKVKGIDARGFAGHLLTEPWQVQTGQGGYYRVYTPFWKAMRARDFGPPEPAPKALRPVQNWPRSDDPVDWRMGAAMRRGAEVVFPHLHIGEEKALLRLDRFIAARVESYKDQRDFPGVETTSGLSENLAWGEIGPRRIWAAGWRALETGAAGAEHFLKELVWREFAYHLMHHAPEITHANWRREWDSFPWRADNPDAEAWRRGMTGEPMVDAGMREMFVTGRMHNRARMIVASYLTKHLLTHWKVGADWFADCLVDWDPASNAMGWQWVAGSGPDAAPYFRVFNPEGQGEKFDADGAYQRRFIAERSAKPDALALSYFNAVPQSWGLRPTQAYPQRLIALTEGRARALRAYAEQRG